MTPGTSRTIDVRRPTRRLNRVDLPTFGRPTMAMIGRQRLVAAVRSERVQQPRARSARRARAATGPARRAPRRDRRASGRRGTRPRRRGCATAGTRTAAPRSRRAFEVALDVLPGEETGHRRCPGRRSRWAPPPRARRRRTAPAPPAAPRRRGPYISPRHHRHAAPAAPTRAARDTERAKASSKRRTRPTPSSAMANPS